MVLFLENSDHIGVYINVASHCIRRKMDSFAAPLGLSGIQIRILGFLEKACCRGEIVYQRDIEKNFGIRPSSVTSVISNLEEKNMLAREAVSGDARLKKLVLTEAGRDANQRIWQNVEAMEADLGSCFSDSQREELIEMLKTIIDRLDTDRTGYCK